MYTCNPSIGEVRQEDHKSRLVPFPLASSLLSRLSVDSTLTICKLSKPYSLRSCALCSAWDSLVIHHNEDSNMLRVSDEAGLPCSRAGEHSHPPC